MNNDTNVNSNNFAQIATVTTTFYSIATGVLPGITYQFKITASNNLGTSL
jgi:hypothetical protein